jgi:hypothetical protein
MTRILATLAILSIMLLAANAIVGLSMGDLYAQPRDSHTQILWRCHFLLGLTTALVVVLVESIIVTYFIGTSRWCKEVVETYQLDPGLVQSSNRLKRRTFPWALAGMLTIVAVIALGGASDPATGQPNTKAWAEWHLAGVIVGVFVILWTYVVAWNNVVANHEIIRRVVDQVAEIREGRGLESPKIKAANG